MVQSVTIKYNCLKIRIIVVALKSFGDRYHYLVLKSRCLCLLCKTSVKVFKVVRLTLLYFLFLFCF